MSGSQIRPRPNYWICVILQNPNSAKNFFDKVDNIRFDNEVTEVSPGTFKTKSRDELAKLY